MGNKILLLLISSIIHTVSCDFLDEYFAKRSQITKAEIRYALGGNVILNDNETYVNNCLMQHKFKEIDYAFDNPQYYNFSHNYFEYKDKMKESKVYKIIKRMPKGGALHVHDMALLGPDYLLNITYMDNLYVSFGSVWQMKFSKTEPNDGQRWRLMKEARESSGNVTIFDHLLRKQLTLDDQYPDIKRAWTVFMRYFTTVCPLLTYRPVWEQYFYDALKRFREDNVMYLEVRSVLPPLYELDGTTYDQLVTAIAYKKTIDRFTKDYPDFVGVKLIYAPSRLVDKNTVANDLDLAKRIKATMPDIFAGFDLVGQEDLGNPLIDFVPELLNATKDLDYFFHAGETDWYGTATDGNLVDAILLGAKRIGHGYALAKHPQLMRVILEKDIGIEVNVISNTVLSLVHDVRNHPISIFLANGLPVVISSDDPGAWEAEPLTDDFYVAFVGASSRLSDLRLLKTFAINSIKYSSLDNVKKGEGLQKFYAKWYKFIEDFKCDSV